MAKCVQLAAQDIDAAASSMPGNSVCNHVETYTIGSIQRSQDRRRVRVKLQVLRFLGGGRPSGDVSTSSGPLVASALASPRR
jgi:hypothetical protein